MKTTGIILIIFSGTGLGLCKSMELSGRLKILERLAQLLLLLKGEIRCTGASLEDAFLDVAKKMPGEYRLFLEETAGRIGRDPALPLKLFSGNVPLSACLWRKFCRKSRSAYFLLGKSWDIWTKRCRWRS